MKICKICGQKREKLHSAGYCNDCLGTTEASLADLAFYPEKEEGICQRCGEYFSDCDCVIYCHDCGEYHCPSESCL